MQGEAHAEAVPTARRRGKLHWRSGWFGDRRMTNRGEGSEGFELAEGRDGRAAGKAECA